MGIEVPYKKSLVAHGYSMCESSRKIEEHLNVGERGLIVYELVSVARDGSPVAITNESEMVIFTRWALYQLAMRLMADIEVIDDGETLILKFTVLFDKSNESEITYILERRVINPVSGAGGVVYAHTEEHK